MFTWKLFKGIHLFVGTKKHHYIANQTSLYLFKYTSLQIINND